MILTLICVTIQYVRDKMGTHFKPNCKHFYQNSHFIEFPFYREKIARLFNFFRFPFPEKQAFWPRNPCCFTSFLSQFPHFREILAIRRLNAHFIEFPFYREKIAAYFGENAIHFPILSNSYFIANALYSPRQTHMLGPTLPRKGGTPEFSNYAPRLPQI